jgi:transcriptional regulator with XRE-family HTH domain
LFDLGVVVARRKALPEGLDPAVVRFVAELRRLKDEKGLSVVQVAERTGYSEASWQRYFGGRALAPREAVEKLVELAGADAATVAALQGAAQEAWKSSGTSVETELAETEPVEAESDAAEPETETRQLPQVQPVSEPRPVRRGIPDPRTVLTSVVSALVGAAVTVLIVQPWSGSTAASAAQAVAKPTPKAPVSYHCTYKRSGGK